ETAGRSEPACDACAQQRVRRSQANGTCKPGTAVHLGSARLGHEHPGQSSWSCEASGGVEKASRVKIPADPIRRNPRNSGLNRVILVIFQMHRELYARSASTAEGPSRG